MTLKSGGVVLHGDVGIRVPVAAHTHHRRGAPRAQAKWGRTTNARHVVLHM
jgi:hypothetical protein